MRPADRELLDTLASTPFIDRLEAVELTGLSRGAVYGGFQRLEGDGLIVSIPHASELIPPTRRYRVTADGLRSLAGSSDKTPASGTGQALDDLLHTRPVSVQWLRLLVERLDALAAVYRLASSVAHIDRPVSLRLYRANPLDAAVTLPGERTVGLVRQGPAADRTAFSRRLWKLGEGPLPGAVLVMASDEVRLRHSRRILRRTPVNALLALERDAVLAGPEDRVWRPAASGAPLDLRHALNRLGPGGDLPAEAPPMRADIPEGRGESAARSLPMLLRPTEKRLLDLIFDWPWISRSELAGLTAVSEQRVSQITLPLEGFGLVTRPAPGSGRLALTDRGLALLARRDRTSLSAARRRWSVAPVDADAPYDWRNVTGGGSRQLLRNVEHTGAVHAFLAALARQALALGWELIQLDPPVRASRHFRIEGATRSVNPDAFGVLRRGPATWPFFLEWERRAVRPSTMSARLAPYLRYYSSRRPADDHGTRPSVLVVFDDHIAETHFLRVAREEMRRTGVDVPLWVSHRRTVEELGPLGRAWRSPRDPEPAQPLLQP